MLVQDDETAPQSGEPANQGAAQQEGSDEEEEEEDDEDGDDAAPSDQRPKVRPCNTLVEQVILR